MSSVFEHYVDKARGERADEIADIPFSKSKDTSISTLSNRAESLMKQIGTNISFWKSSTDANKAIIKLGSLVKSLESAHVKMASDKKR